MILPVPPLTDIPLVEPDHAPPTSAEPQPVVTDRPNPSTANTPGTGGTVDVVGATVDVVEDVVDVDVVVVDVDVVVVEVDVVVVDDVDVVGATVVVVVGAVVVGAIVVDVVGGDTPPCGFTVTLSTLTTGAVVFHELDTYITSPEWPGPRNAVGVVESVRSSVHADGSAVFAAHTLARTAVDVEPSSCSRTRAVVEAVTPGTVVHPNIVSVPFAIRTR